MKGFLKPKLILILAALVMITAAIAIPLSSNIVHSRAASASPPPKTLVGHVPDVVKSGFATFIGHHKGTDSISLAFGLYLRNKQALDQFLSDVGKPSGPRYGQYMTQQEANQAFNPTPQQEQQVITWLKTNGMHVAGTYPNHLLVDGQGTFSQVERMLQISLNDYKYTFQGKEITFYAPANEPTVDGSVGSIVESIVGLDNYPKFHIASNGNPHNTPPYYPQDFAFAYDVNPLWDAGYNGSGQHIGITLWTDPPSDSTLSHFGSVTGASVPTQANKRLKVFKVDNTNQRPPDAGEAGMDIEYASGMAPGAIIDYYEIPVDSQNMPTDAGLEHALNQAGTDANNNQQITSSWGSCEASSISDSFTSMTENILSSNSATGHNYFFSTGDNGSACVPDPTFPCTFTDPYPQYPASSAYVTSVGGTKFTANINKSYPGEVAWTYTASNCPTTNNPQSPVGSGGGYSKLFNRPSWQTGQGLAGNGKRGYPDISADADPNTGAYICYGSNSTCSIDGKPGTYGGGTSLASPLWAGMLANVNQYLLAQRQTPAGFIDPALYWLGMQKPTLAPFHDITSGSNGKYQAGNQWDAVTGWGSTDLYNLARNLVKVLTVNTTSDTAPPCSSKAYSLRCAIIQANNDGQGDTILFSIPSSDSGCKLSSINGKQVFVCTITPTSSLPQLAASSTVINGYTQLGAQQNTKKLGSGDNAIITIRIDGSKGVGGLVLTGNASFDTIQGLEVTSFSSYGILLFPNSVTHNKITGNFIGTDGTNALGSEVGIYIASCSSNNVVGGTTPSTANLISGNSVGVVIGCGSANTIEGNYIGTDRSGTASLHGSKVSRIPSSLSNSGVPNNTGIDVFASASGNLIGGTKAAAANIVAHNTYGVVTEGSSKTSVIGNKISSNFVGVFVENGETGDSISKNTITNSIGEGILVGNSDTDNVHVAIRTNMIFGNGGLGIDLYPGGQINCSGPTAGAPNDYTPCPVILTATTTQVTGTACAGCTVEVYTATNEADDQGHGEGKTFIKSTTADSSGHWSVSATFTTGQRLTATATTPSSPGPAETSEFAANVGVPTSVSGGNLWITGHDADYHCATSSNQCHYLQVAVNFVMHGSTLPLLALDHGSEVATASANAFGSSAPTVDTVDPRTGFASLPLLDSSGKPLYSAIIVASDITCGGCDNNDDVGVTPDSDAINARAADIAQFFNAGGGILALAGADNYDVFYNFLPVAATGATTTSPYTLTSLGLSLGLVEGQDDNCCETHNSFQLPASGSQFQVAETDATGLAETMVVQNGTAVSWTRPTHSSQHRPPQPRNP